MQTFTSLHLCTMITVYNHQHALHQGKLEMFRGQLVPCFEVPARADYVLQELQHIVGPRRYLEAGHELAAEHLELALVQGLSLIHI